MSDRASGARGIGFLTFQGTGMVGGGRGQSWYVSLSLCSVPSCFRSGRIRCSCCPCQPGGQDAQLVAPDLSTHLDSTYLLQTHDHPPAFITVKHEGWRVGPRDVLEKLDDPSQADDIDPKTYSFRVYVHMECGDQRYLHLNTGMWIASGVRRGTEGMASISLPLLCDRHS